MDLYGKEEEEEEYDIQTSLNIPLSGRFTTVYTNKHVIDRSNDKTNPKHEETEIEMEEEEDDDRGKKKKKKPRRTLKNKRISTKAL